MAAPFALITNTIGTLAAGHVVLATEWNTAIGGLYTYINSTLLGGGLNALTTKGDIYGYDGTTLSRLAVGADTQILIADSSQALGVKWGAAANTTALTTKGDLLTYFTGALQRLAVGTDGQSLIADSTQTAGIKWASAAGAVPVGGILIWSGSIAAIPAGYHLCDGTGGTPNLQGLFVVGAGSSGPAAGGLGIKAVGATGGATTHSHSISTSVSGTAGATAATPPVSTNASSGETAVPPYYALAFIQRIS